MTSRGDNPRDYKAETNVYWHVIINNFRGLFQSINFAKPIPSCQLRGLSVARNGGAKREGKIDPVLRYQREGDRAFEHREIAFIDPRFVTIVGITSSRSPNGAGTIEQPSTPEVFSGEWKQRGADWPAISFGRIEKWRTKLRRAVFENNQIPALTAPKSSDDPPRRGREGSVGHARSKARAIRGPVAHLIFDYAAPARN